MPRLILKMPYIKNSVKKPAHLSKLVNYIATRDGVEKINVKSAVNSNEKPAETQKQFIEQLIREFPNIKNSFEYEDYKANPTKENATEFITSALDQNFNQLERKENYIGYIANRPNVEKVGSHGLFTAGDEKISLAQVAKEVANHTGNVWTPIISLKREDAVKTGFDNAEQWKTLLSQQAMNIADSLKIPHKDFKWFAAFHNEGHHPHVHMVCYNANPKHEYLSKHGIEKIKSGLMREIFKEQLFEIYQRQTKSRDELKAETEKAFKELKHRIFQSDYSNPKLEELVLALSEKLKTHKGKKQFGYLQPPLKNLVNAIVDELANEPNIKIAYELWCELQNQVHESYSDTAPKAIPLSAQKEFKSIKNMIIREVESLNIEQQMFRNTDEIKGNVKTERAEYFQTSVKNAGNEKQDNLSQSFPVEWQNNSSKIGSCVLKMIKNLSKVFEDTLPQDTTTTHQKIDSKALRKLREKKLALGQKQDDYEQEQITMTY